MSVRTMTAMLAALVVTGFVWLGLRSTGSPADARLRRLDERRVSDLDQLSNVIDVYWTRERALPPTLSALPMQAGEPFSTRDPERDVGYDNRLIAGPSYELCADFAQPGGLSFWVHGAGRGCFTLEARTVRR